MQRTMIKLSTFLKYSLAFIMVITLNKNAHAEYYVVDPAPYVICIYCGKKTISNKHICNGKKYVSKKRIKHKRHVRNRTFVYAKETCAPKRPRVNSYKIEVYYPKQSPSCCGAVFMPDCYGCGQWVPSYPPAGDVFVSYAPDPAYGAVYVDTDPYWDYARATSDDYAFQYPEMQISNNFDY